MPLTRLIRLTLVLSWIMFLLYVFFLDVNRWEIFRHISLLLGLILWGYTLFLSVKQSGPFDELCFHRTRPNGDCSAFWRHTKILGWTLLLVFCAMLARGFWYHLGTRTSLVGALTLTLLLAVFGAVFSTGFSLYITGVYRKKLALALLLYVPLLCAIIVIGDALPYGLSLRSYALFSWHSGITYGLLISFLCASSAWFFAGSLRRWKTSLALAVSAIYLLPLYLGNGSLLSASYSTAKLQTNPIKIRLRKNINEADRKHSCSVAQFLRCEEPMQVGEFVTLRFEFPENSESLHRFKLGVDSSRVRSDFPDELFSLSSAYGRSPVVQSRKFTHCYPIPDANVLEGLFPNARFSDFSSISLLQSSHFDPKLIASVYNLLSDSKWKCSGMRYLLTRAASFRLDTGGVCKTDGGGFLKVAPFGGKGVGLTAQVHEVRPLTIIDKATAAYAHLRFYMDMHDYEFVLSNADESKAIVMSDSSRSSSMQFGAESSNVFPYVRLDQLKDWTAEDIRDAKIHVLETKTLERIQFDQTHLILEE